MPEAFQKNSLSEFNIFGEKLVQPDGTLQMQSLQGYKPSTEAVKRHQNYMSKQGVYPKDYLKPRLENFLLLMHRMYIGKGMV